MKNFTDSPTRFLFFTGKGGVGKTSLACALAVQLADQGKKILLVSTDPASNLDEVLGTKLGGEPTPIVNVAGLFALNINPDEAAQAYRERSLAPLRGSTSEKTIREMEEQLSGACTVEIAAFDEFTSLLVSGEKIEIFDHIIFDTAPTGHTLRLLSLPAAWSDYLGSPAHAASCLGPSAALRNQRERYVSAVETLKSESLTTIVLVTRPDQGAIAEAERTSKELDDLGLSNQQVAINSIFRATDPSDPIAVAFERKSNQALEGLSSSFKSKVAVRIALKPYNLVGLESLRRFLKDEPADMTRQGPSDSFLPHALRLADLVDQIEADKKGLIMVMGKGGVGKTTVAAAVAVELASRGHSVHLTTTDPAAHLDATMAGSLPLLRVDHIDPKAETQRYSEQVIQSTGKDLDVAGVDLLREDLKSPCTEEVAVFRAFTRVVNEARDGFVVVDTAPTGHTLLLLDTAGSYHREVMRSFGGSEEKVSHVTTPMMRLKDASYTKILLVTLAETTPVSEAAALQTDLRRAGIEPYAWVVNQCIAVHRTTDPLLAARARSEIAQIGRINDGLGKRMAVVPWAAERPVGVQRLRALSERR